MPATLIAKMPFARDAVELGRMVVNADHPLHDYFQPPGDPPSSHQGFASLHDALSASGRFSVAAYLSRIFSLSYDSVSDRAVFTRAPAASKFELKNSNEWFEHLRASGKGRIWLSKCAARRKSPYLVVGYVVAKDAYIAEKDGTLTISNTRIKIPTDALTGAIGVAASAVMGEAGFQIEHFSNYLQGGSFVALGEQILAIEYRSIRLGTFWSHDVDKMDLEKGSWWKVAVKGPGEAEGSDAIVAELADDDVDSETANGPVCETEGGILYIHPVNC